MFDTAFSEIASILLIAAIVGAVGSWLRQPLIVSFIAVGVLVGPAGLGIVTQHEEIELLASVGISLLLFVVGLKLDVYTIRTIGPVALATGLGQIVFTSAIGFAIALAMGMTPLTATYVAVALTFSSTIIIVKLLSDKREIDALHGRIAVGFLIVQDVAVIAAMIGITAIGGGPGGSDQVALHAASIALKGVIFIGAIAALAVWVLPPVAGRLARAPELLVLAAIAWAVTLAAAGDLLGFSKEVGAFLAGASLAATPYREAIGSRLVTVRDFLLLFFFIDLGARLDLSMLGATIGAALVFSVFVLVGNPLIVMVIMGAMGYRRRTGFLAGLTVAQISEFSLILAALGLSVGHISTETMGLITTVGLVTIGLSTYMILYSGTLYEWLAPWLRIFERRAPYREMASDAAMPPAADVVVFGLGRYGGGILRHLRLRGRRVIGVDFDPETLARWREEGVPVLYGDASDAELFEHLPLGDVRWVVSTAPDVESSRLLLHHLRQRGFPGRIAIACRTADESDLLRLEGADVLLRPYADAAEQAVDAITTAMDRLSEVATAAPGLHEVRLGPDSMWAGHRIADVPLRDEFGVTVLAVSRAGRSFFNPGPTFQLFPGDRVILSGEPAALQRAVDYLGQVDHPERPPEADAFAVEEVRVGDVAGWSGHSLADLALPSRFGITVLATRRDERLVAPDPRRTLRDDDQLVLTGTREALDRLRLDRDEVQVLPQGPGRGGT
jgi:Kef-type K+ transport system membrane component KefB/Trk K+ transport system NAD-binding subunit